MKFGSRFLQLGFAALLCLWPLAGHAGHFKTYSDRNYETPMNPGWIEEDRTAGRTPAGIVTYPRAMMQRPEHYEFTPLVSNWDAQNSHPQQWDGQDWDPSKWNPQQWTPEIAVKKFYEGHIFDRQYMHGKMPVLVLGPIFYQLSDLDQRRTLKLLTDYTGIFNKGYTMIELRDWNKHYVVGSYSPKGLYMD